MTACTTDANALALWNVHNTHPSPSFLLQAPSLFQACEDQGALLLCLLPPSSRLTAMCLQTRNDYFEQILDGHVKTVEDLPVVWQTTRGDATQPGWIAITQSPNVTYRNLAPYLGLQPLPSFLDLATSNAFGAFWGVAGGRLFRYNPAEGMMEEHSLQNNFAGNVAGNDDDRQSVALSSDGTLGAVLFSNRLVLWQQGTFTDVSVGNYAYHNVKIFSSSPGVEDLLIVGFNQNTGTLTTWHYSAPGGDVWSIVRQTNVPAVGVTAVLQYVALDTTGTSALIGIDRATNTTTYELWQVPILNNAQPTPTAPVATLTRFSPSFFVSGRWQAISRGPNNRILALHKATTVLVDVVWGAGFGSTTIRATGMVSLVEPLSRVWQALIDQQGNVLFGASATIPIYGTAATPANFGNNTSGLVNIAFTPDSQATIVLTGASDLWFNANTVPTNTFGSVWTLQRRLFLNEDSHVSDFGLLGDLPPLSSAVWFFGITVTPLVARSQISTSPHGYYQLVTDSAPVRVSGQPFAALSATLYQLNFSGLVAQGLPTHQMLQLANNSNLQLFGDATVGVVWESRTTDGFSDPSVDVAIDPVALLSMDPGVRTVYGSENGLYLVFADDANVTIAYNVYNSGAFAEFCRLVGERPARALARQKEFCFDGGLFNATTTVFADNRCTCLAGAQGVDLFFPNQNLADTTRARLVHNLPCLLTTCNRLPEVTNVYDQVVKPCAANQHLTVCSSLIIGAGTLTIGAGFVNQNCGSNVLKCAEDIQCPIGTVCVGGSCVSACKINGDCPLGFQCMQGVCIATTAAAAAVGGDGPTSSTDRTVTILMIILIVLFVLSVLAFVLVMLFTRPKMQKVALLPPAVPMAAASVATAPPKTVESIVATPSAPASLLGPTA